MGENSRFNFHSLVVWNCFHISVSRHSCGGKRLKRQLSLKNFVLWKYWRQSSETLLCHRLDSGQWKQQSSEVLFCYWIKTFSIDKLKFQVNYLKIISWELLFKCVFSVAEMSFHTKQSVWLSWRNKHKIKIYFTTKMAFLIKTLQTCRVVGIFYKTKFSDHITWDLFTHLTSERLLVWFQLKKTPRGFVSGGASGAKPSI